MFDKSQFSLLKLTSYSNYTDHILNQLYGFTPYKPKKCRIDIVRNEQYLSTDIISQILKYEISDDDIANLLVGIRSPLGTGKTTLIKQTLTNPKLYLGPLLIITNRVCLVESIAVALNLDFYQDFRRQSGAYKNEKGEIITMSTYVQPTPGKYGLVITTDSVHQLEKIDITGFTVIIDEAVSVANTIMMADTDVAGHRLQTYNKILDFVSKAKRTILLDAHLDNVTMDFYRPVNSPSQRTIAIVNKYIRAYDNPIQLYHAAAEGSFFAHVDSVITVEEGSVWIACDCKHTTATLFDRYRVFKKKNGNYLNVICINSSNSKSPHVQKMLKNPDLFYDYDLVITSPSTDVGLSVDVSDDPTRKFVLVAMIIEYGYYSPFKVEQAMNRVRDLSTERIIYQRGGYFNIQGNVFAPYLKVDFYHLYDYIKDNTDQHLYTAHFIDHLYKNCVEMHTMVSGAKLTQAMVYRALLKFIISFTGNTYVEIFSSKHAEEDTDASYFVLKNAKTEKSAQMFEKFYAEVLSVVSEDPKFPAWSYFFPIDLFSKNPDRAAKLSVSSDKSALEFYSKLPEANQLVARIQHYYGSDVGISPVLVSDFEKIIYGHELLRMYITKDYEYLSTSHTDIYVPGHQRLNHRKWMAAYDRICYFSGSEFFNTTLDGIDIVNTFNIDLTYQCQHDRYTKSIAHVINDVIVKGLQIAFNQHRFHPDQLVKLTEQRYCIETVLEKTLFTRFLGNYYVNQINPYQMGSIEEIGQRFINSAIMLDKLSLLQTIGELSPVRRGNNIMIKYKSPTLPNVVTNIKFSDPDIVIDYNESKRFYILDNVELLNAIDFHSENVGAKESMIQRPYYWNNKHPLYYQNF